MTVPADAAARAAEVARAGYGRLVALLAAADGDIAAAEDALGDALEQALRRWPTDGVPHRPEAWLLTVARNRQRDRWRSAAHRTSVELEPDRHSPALPDDLDPEALPDHRLALMSACAHPAIDPGVRTPLMLNAVLGCTAEQVGRAMSVPTATMASRLVRAKRRIREAGIPVEVPGIDALPQRMDAIREAVHGVHAIEWAASDPEPRSDLVGEALHLSELLSRLAPRDAEAHGLAALVALSAARLPARGGPDGYVPLAEQDPAVWDADLIDRGEEHLRAGHMLGELGRFQVEAAIQAVHCARRRTGSTDWPALRRPRGAPRHRPDPGRSGLARRRRRRGGGGSGRARPARRAGAGPPRLPARVGGPRSPARHGRSPRRGSGRVATRDRPHDGARAAAPPRGTGRRARVTCEVRGTPLAPVDGSQPGETMG